MTNTKFAIELEKPKHIIQPAKYYYYNIIDKSELGNALSDYKNNIHLNYQQYLSDPNSNIFTLRIEIPWYKSVSEINNYIMLIFEQLSTKCIDLSNESNYMMMDNYFYVMGLSNDQLILIGQFQNTIPYFEDLLQINPFCIKKKDSKLKSNLLSLYWYFTNTYDMFIQCLYKDTKNF